MLVKDYFEANKTIFNSTKINALVPNLLSSTDITVLNKLFYSKFTTCDIPEETEAINQDYAAYIIYKHKDFYGGIKAALDAEIDPLNPTNITTTTEYSGSVENSKSGKEKNTRTPNLTTTNTAGIYNEVQDVPFDSSTLTTHEKNLSGGSDSTTNTGTEVNEIEFTNRKDTTNFINRKDEVTREGYENIDFDKALKSYYESKSLNLFETILTDVADELVIPIFEF